jgi:hypothetical protein
MPPSATGASQAGQARLPVATCHGLTVRRSSWSPVGALAGRVRRGSVSPAAECRATSEVYERLDAGSFDCLAPGGRSPSRTSAM